MQTYNIIRIPLVKNGKAPICKGWQNLKATPTNDFQDHNTGMLINKDSGLFVVDIDVKDEGISTWNKLIAIHGEPKTWIQDTPSGGIHYIFKHPKFNMSRKIKINGVGIDLLCNGSNLVIEPSIINGKKYKFRNTIDDIQELPSWLFNYANIDNRVVETKKETKLNPKTVSVSVGKEVKAKFDAKIEDVEKVLDRFKLADFSDYEKWFQITCCLKSENLFATWEKYSKKSPKYNAKNNLKVWNSLDPIIDLNYLGVMLGLKTSLFKPFKKYEPNTIYSFTSEMNMKYLDSQVYLNHDTIAIKSCTGTGKTTSFIKYIKEYESESKIISITPRICLAEAHAELFNKKDLPMKCYNTMGLDTSVPKFFSVQLDSLAKYNYFQLSETVIYLDEFNSLINYLIQSDTLINKRRSVYVELVNVIRNAKKVIATDADMSDIAIKFLSKIRADCHFINNKYQNCVGIKAIKYNGDDKKDQIVDTMKQYVKNDQPFILCTDTKRDADLIHNLIFDETKKDKFVIHTSETELDISNINALWKDKFVIYSPKIIYGLDFDPEVAQPVLVISRGCTINPLNIAQQVARTRKISELHFCICDGQEWNQFKNLGSVKVYYNDNLNKYIDTFSQMGCINGDEEESIELSIKENLFSDMYFMYAYNNDIFKTNKLRHFENIITSKGFEIIEAEKYQGLPTDWAKAKNEVMEGQFQEYYNVIDNKCTNQILKQAIKDRWELVNTINENDKLKYINILYNNNEFSRHFTVCRMFESVAKNDERIKKNCVHEFKTNFLTGELYKVSLLKEMEIMLDIAPLIVDDMEQSTINMSENLYLAIMKAFNIRSKVVIPTNRKELLPTYVKCVNQLFQVITISEESRTRVSKDDRGKRTYKYETKFDDIETHLQLLRLRNKDFKNINDDLLDYFPETRTKFVENTAHYCMIKRTEPEPVIKEIVISSIDSNDTCAINNRRVQDLHSIHILSAMQAKKF